MNLTEEKKEKRGKTKNTTKNKTKQNKQFNSYLKESKEMPRGERKSHKHILSIEDRSKLAIGKTKGGMMVMIRVPMVRRWREQECYEQLLLQLETGERQ